MAAAADRHPGAADAAVVEPGEDHDHHDQQHEFDEVVVGEARQRHAEHLVGLAEVELAEGEVGNAGDAVGAACEPVEVEGGDAEDLAEAEGDDGEVVAP
jgi:hypothetical protein